MTELRTSVVIVSDGRRDALIQTIESLRWLNAAEFEVVVVCGPTPDGSHGAVADFGNRIKTCHCPVRNISVARNIGIAAAAGDIIAFLDDDAIPEPEWLVQLLLAYVDPKVGGAGGFVYDHTGVKLQYRYSTANRLGRADFRTTSAADFNFPLSESIPYIQGANSSFRRQALISIGGFDEEIEFYLDETDVCCRLVDEGWTIQQLPDAAVHHKFLPSAIRAANRVTKKRYAIIKNKIYYSFVNNKGHYSEREIIEDAEKFILDHEEEIKYHVRAGNMVLSDLDGYYFDVEAAWRDGLHRGVRAERRTRSRDFFGLPPPFLRFETLEPADGRGVFCFVTQEYPPETIGGIGRHIFDLAQSIALRGHQVHVITKDTSHNRLDFEHGVWVHRLVSPPSTMTRVPSGWTIPVHIWAHSINVADEIRKIDAKRPVQVVHTPIWDCEGVALAVSREFPLVVGLHTTQRQWLDSHPDQLRDAQFMSSFGNPMLSTEARLLKVADAVHGNSAAIVEEIRRGHGVALDAPRLKIVPHGLRDERDSPAEPPNPLPPGAVRLLFVGRLEGRKGIQVLLPVVRRLLGTRPWLYVDIVGNDSLPGPEGETYREVFENTTPVSERSRIVFHGQVPVARLRGFYSASDVVVAPSLFESFGLVLVEAMMYGKATVACRAGGMVEVGVADETTLFAEAGDEASLQTALERILDDAELRARLGKAGRRRFETHFSAERMADGVLKILASAAERWARSQRIAAYELS